MTSQELKNLLISSCLQKFYQNFMPGKQFFPPIFLAANNRQNKFMAQSCTLCGKKSILSVTLVKLRGKFNPTSKRRQYPNLQWLTLPSGKRVKACTKCIKAMGKK